MASTFDNVTITGTLTVMGEFTPVGGLAEDSVTRAMLVEEPLTEYPVPLTNMRVTGTGALLGNAAGTPAGAFGLNMGVAGVATPLVESEDAYYNSKTNKMRFEYVLGPEYVDGTTVQLKIHAKVGTAMATSQTLDVICYRNDKEGGDVATDLCATAQKDLTTSYADYTFSITTATLVQGDVLDIEITGVADDTGGTANDHITIGSVKVLMDTKG